MPNAGHPHVIDCIVSGHQTLAEPVITYEWMKNKSMKTRVGNGSSTLYFHSLTLSDADEYICTATVQSKYLNSRIIVGDVHVVRLTSEWRVGGEEVVCVGGRGEDIMYVLVVIHFSFWQSDNIWYFIQFQVHYL